MPGGTNLLKLFCKPLRTPKLPKSCYFGRKSIDFIGFPCQNLLLTADTLTAGQVRPKFSGGKLLRKDFAFGEISLQIWRLRRQKIVIIKQIFLRNFFKNSRFFWVPANALQVANSSYFRDLKKVCRNLYMKPMFIYDTDLRLRRAQTDKHHTDAHKLFRSRGC